MTNAQTYDFDEFREELVRRFFNTHSYFFACFSNQLKNLSKLSKEIQDDDYFLIAQVLEFLKNAENPESELKRLAEIERLHDFDLALDETLQKLRQPNLPTDEMKEAINLLAIDLVDALVQVIHELSTKRHLLEIVTGETELDLANETIVRSPVEENEPDEDLSASAKTIPEDGATGKIIEEPVGEVDDLFTKEKELMLDDIKFNELEELASESGDLSEDEFDLNVYDLKSAESEGMPASSPDPADDDFSDDLMTVVPATFSDSRIEYDNTSENEVAEPEQVEERHEKLNDTSPQPAVSPEILPKRAPTQEIATAEEINVPVNEVFPAPRMNAGDLNFIDDLHEPAGLNKGFISAAKKTVAEIRDMVDKLQPGKNVQKQLKTLQEAFLDFRESAMIHGFEAAEELAQKSQKLMQQLKHPYQHLQLGNIRFISEIIECLDISLKENLAQGQQAQIRKIIQRITQNDIVNSEHAETNNAAINSSTGSTAARSTPVPEKVVEIEKPPAQLIAEDTPASDTTSEQPVVAPDPELAENDNYGFEVEADDRQQMIKLPGENDEELFKLIKEISEHSINNRDVKKAHDQHGTEEPVADSLTIRDDYLNGNSLESNAEMIEFHSEAELYYRVAFEAIERLSGEPSDRLALENLELAGYSLKGLAKKMGMDGFANFPELVEDLIAKVLQLHLPCTEKPLAIINQGFTLHKNATSINDMETPEFKKVHREIIRFVQSLEDFTQTNVN